MISKERTNHKIGSLVYPVDNSHITRIYGTGNNEIVTNFNGAYNESPIEVMIISGPYTVQVEAFQRTYNLEFRTVMHPNGDIYRVTNNFVKDPTLLLH